jgi:succinate-acetate transporter protein
MEGNTTLKIQDNTANPAPLGLLGFGMTTILLNIANAGIIHVTSMIMGMGIFVGGMAQVIAGIMEWKKNNTFGMTAFTAYGLFWLALVTTWILPDAHLAKSADPISMGFFLLAWGIFTSMMYIGSLKSTTALQTVFFSLAVLFFLLAIADFSMNITIRTIAGYEGIFCGLSAVYLSLAQVLNEVYGKVVLPVGAKK